MSAILASLVIIVIMGCFVKWADWKRNKETKTPIKSIDESLDDHERKIS